MSGVIHVPCTSPTIVSHCDVGALCGPGEAAHLVLARGSVLEAYTLREEPAPSARGATAMRRAVLDGVGAAKLELVARSSLNGIIESLRIVRPINAPRDRVLLAFADAKVSVLELDSVSHSFTTVAAHAFEKLDDATACGQLHAPPMLRANASGSCAALLSYGTHLVLLPVLEVRGTGGAPSAGGLLGPASLLSPPLEALTAIAGAPLSVCADAVSAAAAAAATATASSAAGVSSAAGTSSAGAGACKRIDLGALGLVHVRDVAFVEGYAEPVLGVLCEPEQTWSGRLAFKNDTVTLACLQLCTGGTSFAPLWEVRGLPHDTTSVLPLPAPVGGLLALSDHVLLWLGHAHVYGLALNRDASCTCVPQLAACPPTMRLRLQGATASLFSRQPLRVALSLASGDLYLVRLHADGRGVNGMDLEKLATSVPACCSCVLARRYLFLGSRVADSLLLQLAEAFCDPAPRRHGRGPSAAEVPPGTQQRLLQRLLLPSPLRRRHHDPRRQSLLQTSGTAGEAFRVPRTPAEDGEGAKAEVGARASEVETTATAAMEADGALAEAPEPKVKLEPGTVAAPPVPPAKRPRLSSGGGIDFEGLELVEMAAEIEMATSEGLTEEESEALERAEDAFLYGAGGEAAAGAAGGAVGGSGRPPRGSVRAMIRDSFPSTAPLADVAPFHKAVAARGAPAAAGSEAAGWEVLLCGGRGRSGALTLLGRGIHVTSVAAFDLPPCDVLFTLPATASHSEEPAAPSCDAAAQGTASGGGGGGGEEFHQLLLLSGVFGTRVLSTGDEISEITQSTGLFLQGPTILLAPLRGGRRAVQVHAAGVRLLRGHAFVSELAAPSGRAITRASAAADWVLVLLDNGSPWLLQLSADGDSLKPPAVLSQPQLPPFVAASLYDDASTTFGGEAAEAGEAARAAAPMVVVRAASGGAACRDSIEAEALSPAPGSGSRRSLTLAPPLTAAAAAAKKSAADAAAMVAMAAATHGGVLLGGELTAKLTATLAHAGTGLAGTVSADQQLLLTAGTAPGAAAVGPDSRLRETPLPRLTAREAEAAREAAVRVAAEEAALYAPTAAEARAHDACKPPSRNAASGAAHPSTTAPPSPSQLLCVTCDAAGCVSVWALPQWNLLFSSPSAMLLGASVVHDQRPRGGRAVSSAGGAGASTPRALAVHPSGGSADNADAADGAGTRSAAAAVAAVVAVEVRFFPVRRRDSPPLLALYFEPHELLLFRAVKHAALDVGGSAGSSRGSFVSFVRVPHGVRRLLPRVTDGLAEEEAAEAAGGRALTAFEAASRLAPLGPRPSRLVPLDHFGGVDGPLDGAVLVLGETAAVLCMQRDTVWTHELLPPAGGTGLEDAIVCAAPLHNINCPHGVVLMGRGGRLHISSVRAPPRAASATRYDVAWPMTKMGLRATGHYVCHLPLAKAIVVAISVAELLPDTAPQPKNPNAPNAKADNVAVAALEGAPRYQERYELRLLDETTWATLDTYPLGEQEWVTALQLMTLQREMPNPNAPNPATLPAHLRNLPMSAERIRKPTPLLVVGTAVVLGEDSNCTGRLLLLDIDSVLEGGAGKGGGEAGEGEGEGDADEGSMRMVRRFRVAVDHEERGPILSVAQMQGKLQVRLSHSGPLLGSS